MGDRVMTTLEFTALSLGCFRLTRLITDDKITDWLRSIVIRKAPAKAKEKAREGITCPFCVSFYFAMILGIYAWYIGGWTPIDELCLWIFAIWGASILFNQLFCYLTNEP